MTLLSPWLLLGLLGLGLPIAAHLLGRATPRPIPFAAVRLLAAAPQATARRRTIRDPWLFSARALLLALAVVLLARPASEDAADLRVLGEPHDAVIVVDASASMDLRVDGSSGRRHALTLTERLAAALPPGSRVALATSDPEGPRVPMSADRDAPGQALRVWLDDGNTAAGAWDPSTALGDAAALLQAAPPAAAGRPAVVYVITDGGGAALPSTLDGGPRVVAMPAWSSDLALPEHVGIDSVTWAPALDVDPRAVTIEATVHRHAGSGPRDDAAAQPSAEGDAPARRRIRVMLAVNDREVTATEVDLAADAPTPVRFTHTLAGDAVPPVRATVAVDVADDPLPTDDRRRLWIAADDALEVLVVNGDPSEQRANDEVYFLGTALAALEGRLRVRTIAPDQLDDRVREAGLAALADVDVLVLANVRAPAPDVADTLIAAVRAGMGLWITAGERVSAREYGERLGPLLPLLPRETVVVGTAVGRAEAVQDTLAPPDVTHPALRGLPLDAGLDGATTRKVLLLEPDPSRAAAIALAYSSGAPALITRELDGGRVALLTTSIDRDWGDLALRPGFVALVERMVTWLGRGAASLEGANLAVGAARSVRAPPGVTPVVLTPTGDRVVVAADETGARRFVHTRALGHYRVEGAESPRDVGAAPLDVFTVDVDPREALTVAFPTDAGTDPDPTGAAEARAIPVLTPRWREAVPWLALLLALETLLRLRARRRAGRR